MALARERADWAVGFADETWWSRVARPALHAWTADDPLRLVERRVPDDDPDPKALACYGVLLRHPESTGEAGDVMWLRFVDGRPVSSLSEQFLAWCCQRLAAAGIRTVVLVWDNASWHVSKAVRRWQRTHNQQAHRVGGVRIVPCWLPSKSPWLNPIEPKWVHGKRRVVESARLLSAQEVEERVCAAFGCPLCDHLTIPQEVA
jgi:transposase